MTRRKTANFAFAAAFFCAALLLPGRAYPFPWSLDMWVQPSVDPYEKPTLYPKNSLSRKASPKMPREDIEAIEKSPVEPTAESIKRGAELFSHNCVSCHGPKGLGDGLIIMKGHGFYPVNLAAPGVVARTDGYIYAYIMYGGKVMMPAYWENMPLQSDGWQVVNYVRHLQKAVNAEEGDREEKDGQN